ncbi:hypothetical protein [Peptoanaerobacter stomatis]
MLNEEMISIRIENKVGSKNLREFINGRLIEVTVKVSDNEAIMKSIHRTNKSKLSKMADEYFEDFIHDKNYRYLDMHSSVWHSLGITEHLMEGYKEENRRCTPIERKYYLQTDDDVEKAFEIFKETIDFLKETFLSHI